MVVYTVLEDEIRRQIRRAERTTGREALARGLENQGFERVGEWIVDGTDGEELIAFR